MCSKASFIVRIYGTIVLVVEMKSNHADHSSYQLFSPWTYNTRLSYSAKGGQKPKLLEQFRRYYLCGEPKL